ncbi:SubName: Full=Uncharacterized protein {ECO:0000313/EMBL:CCA75179.1} [Serendipita indica DSM 11827]|nr:SubName: Full=Uncharacterized protein {ECO:0000313/EMBL:CCA75179.1} [Serendipita indica DSM 11827]
MSSIDEFRKYKFEEDEEFNARLCQMDNASYLTFAKAIPQQYRDLSGSYPTTKQAEEPVLTFAEIKHLIETGQAHLIPNNKVIPDKINDETPSRSIAPVRRKPWEVAQTNEANVTQT